MKEELTNKFVQSCPFDMKTGDRVGKLAFFFAYQIRYRKHKWLRPKVEGGCLSFRMQTNRGIIGVRDTSKSNSEMLAVFREKDFSGTKMQSTTNNIVSTKFRPICFSLSIVFELSPIISLITVRSRIFA
jgi:hypothetical protein